MVGIRLEPGAGLAGKVLQTGRPMLTNDYRSIAGLPAGSPFERYHASLAIPFEWSEELRGIISVGYARPHHVTQDDLSLLETFAELAAAACRNASLHAGIAQAARTDGLTGCLNHAALHESLQREIERAARVPGRDLSLILIDLNDFKQVNEEHGHLVGDEVLRRVGHALRNGTRPYDIAARYGGDEFALLAVESDEEQAGEIARRTIARVAAAAAEFGDISSGGATAGVAEWAPGLTATQLIARADRALLHGKQRGGRGEANLFSELPEPESVRRFESRFGPAPAAPAAARPARHPRRGRRAPAQAHAPARVANALGTRLVRHDRRRRDPRRRRRRAPPRLRLLLLRGRAPARRRPRRGAAVRGDAFLPSATAMVPAARRRPDRPLPARAPPRRLRRRPRRARLQPGAGDARGPLRAGRPALGRRRALGRAEHRGDRSRRLPRGRRAPDGDGRRPGRLRPALGLAYEQLERAYMGTAEALAAALEAKDSYTARHARSIVELAEAVGRRLGMDAGELRDLRFGAVFHDIGKIAVPEAILNKPGPLTPEERPRSSATRSSASRSSRRSSSSRAPAARPPRARALGRRGYPDGLAGTEIPLGSRIILACDALHAMTTDRPYRPAMSSEQAGASCGRTRAPSSTRASWRRCSTSSARHRLPR